MVSINDYYNEQENGNDLSKVVTMEDSSQCHRFLSYLKHICHQYLNELINRKKMTNILSSWIF